MWNTKLNIQHELDQIEQGHLVSDDLSLLSNIKMITNVPNQNRHWLLQIWTENRHMKFPR